MKRLSLVLSFSPDPNNLPTWGMAVNLFFAKDLVALLLLLISHIDYHLLTYFQPCRRHDHHRAQDEHYQDYQYHQQEHYQDYQYYQLPWQLPGSLQSKGVIKCMFKITAAMDGWMCGSEKGERSFQGENEGKSFIWAFCCSQINLFWNHRWNQASDIVRPDPRSQIQVLELPLLLVSTLFVLLSPIHDDESLLVRFSPVKTMISPSVTTQSTYSGCEPFMVRISPPW